MHAALRVSEVTYWEWIGRGKVWGVRGDGAALADLALFDGGVGIVVVMIKPVKHEGRRYYELARGAEYPARLWQPRDFLGGAFR